MKKKTTSFFAATIDLRIQKSQDNENMFHLTTPAPISPVATPTAIQSTSIPDFFYHSGKICCTKMGYVGRF